MNLPEQWRMSLEDAVRTRPEILWFMGVDARVDGLVSSFKKLPAWGCADGRTARRDLMRMAAGECHHESNETFHHEEAKLTKIPL